MKKFLIIFLVIVLQNLLAMSEPLTLNGEVTFDWLTRSQIERDENIMAIKNELFNDDTVLRYNKKEFKSELRDNIKDKDIKYHHQNLFHHLIW